MTALLDDAWQAHDDSDPGPTDADYTAGDAAPDIDTSNEATALVEANRHLRVIARVRRERDILDAVYRAEMDRLTVRYHAQRSRLSRMEEWHTAPVVALHSRIREADDRRKTIVLPHGTLRSRGSKQVRYDVQDAEAFVAWAEANDAAELVRVTKAPAASEFKTRLRVVDGNVVDTVTGAVLPDTMVTGAVPDTKYDVVTGGDE